jgi:hypothetical protein
MIDKRIADTIGPKTANGEITCLEAAAIAEELHVPMAAVGTTLDLVNVWITECQLELFGYRPIKKITTPAETFDQYIERAIRRDLVNG